MNRAPYIVLCASLSCTLLAGCGGGEDIEAGTLPEGLELYTPPAYPDDYTGIAGWHNRSLWNLANVHDPTVMLADDGYYYMYQTDASYGNVHTGHGHFHARRSRNLVDWEYLGATMDAAPAWVEDSLNAYRTKQGLPPIEDLTYGYWAPSARTVGKGLYRMYYSIVPDHYIQTGMLNTEANWDGSWTERAFIGLMECTDPGSNLWVDKGFVLCSASDKDMNDWGRTSRTNDWNAYFLYNAIDPAYSITQEGEHWLAYGSWHSGIAALQLDPATGKPLRHPDAPWNINASSGYGKRIARRDNSRWQGSEAAEIIYNPETGYYYLFLAYDELSVAYNTRVGRSRSVEGPYMGIDGTDVTAGGNLLPVVTHPYKFMEGNGWVGLSHCTVFDDGKGNWFYASQGRMPHGAPGIQASNAIMMGHVRAIRWTSDGWPLVMPERYGNLPDLPILESELTGDWEHIDLSYRYAAQKEASLLTLDANHTISAGLWKGNSWSYDATEQVLTANGVKLYLRREPDWEASPRRPTLVYAGYTTTKTYWGKKK
jgi:beta-xylosidase